MKCRMLLASMLVFLFFSSLSLGADVAAPNDPHAQLDQILHRPLYSAWRLREGRDLPEVETRHRRVDSWLRYLSDKIDEFWQWLFPEQKSSTQPSDYATSGFLPKLLKVTAWTITIIGLGFIAVLLVKILRGSDVAGLSAHILSRQQIQQAMESGDALALKSAEWLDEAQRLAADQNFRMVYRALYLALLSGLHSAGKIDHNPNRTNWTYVQNYRGPGTERDLFSQLTDLFDRIWYGHKNAGSENLPKLREDVRILIGSGGGG
jgi:hypothetical protein